MTPRAALQLLAVVALDRGRDADPATANLWSQMLPEIPDQDVAAVSRRLVRDGVGGAFLPTTAGILTAWRSLRAERARERRLETERAERSQLADLSPAETAANLERLRELCAAATPTLLQPAASGAAATNPAYATTSHEEAV